MPDITPPKREDDDKRHTTRHEKFFFDRMNRKKKGEKYRQAIKKRVVWNDGVGTNINQCKLFEHMLLILGEDPYAEHTD